MPRIVVENGPEAGRAFDVARDVVIGRGAMPDVSVADARISRRHAQLVRIATGRHALVDLGSQNGTLLNGKRLVKPALLHSGDRFVLGDVSFRFEDDPAPAAAGADPHPAGPSTTGAPRVRGRAGRTSLDGEPGQNVPADPCGGTSCTNR